MGVAPIVGTGSEAQAHFGEKKKKRKEERERTFVFSSMSSKFPHFNF
jgi:hypothetical protein